ncbi:MAG: hypothetical protein OEL88_09310 [Sterolibacteriaceae bacterium MAG5]|nr:hypothetical protein [Candidatus Nitricoxidireducens bremensis]
MNLLLGGIAAALVSFGAAAQPGPGMQGMGGPGPGSRAAGECAKARDPERCEALQKAKEVCKDKRAAEKKQCMQDAMPPMDCSKARNPLRCEDHQKAKEICKGKTGRDHRQCMKENTPKRGKGGKGGK